MSTKPTRPTGGLEAPGRALWRSLAMQVHDDGATFDARELALLTAACREADMLDSIERALDGQPRTVKGAQGQLVAHPLLGEARRSRQTIHSLLKGIGLDDPRPKAGLLGSGLSVAEAGRKGGLARGQIL